MTREELKRHCEKQIEECERWAKHKGEEPHGKIYEEHKLILELLEQQPCEDTISRADAVRVASGYCHPANIAKELAKLPPVQPEIIRCKDCKWKNNHNCTRAVEVWIDDDKFCAWAERRTDE